MVNDKLIICRGGGDLATGIVHRLTKAGFRTLILEKSNPSAIRRQVSFSEAVYETETTIEGITARLIKNYDEINEVFDNNQVPVLVDTEAKAIHELKPDIVIDAMIAKENLGTDINMADLVIGVGPGFTAGMDVHVVIETMRGHNLGRIITDGSAMPNTGIPGVIAGYSSERVIHAEKPGVIRNTSQIGSMVKKDDEIARIYDGVECQGDYFSVRATISGVLRGLIRDGYYVSKGFKIADIDPREGEIVNCFTISDKSRSIGGSVLEVVCAHFLDENNLD